MQEDSYYLNKEVSRICEISSRQVISWTEKGLVIPFEESTGVGKKRLYDYVNLLEFAFCDALLNSIGMGFRLVKKITKHLRSEGSFAAWATNFKDYHEKRFKGRKAAFEDQLKSMDPHNEEYVFLEKTYKEFLSSSVVPEKPVGFLVYFLGPTFESVDVIPWELKYAVDLNIIREGFKEHNFGFLLDLGAIKQAVDRNI